MYRKALLCICLIVCLIWGCVQTPRKTSSIPKASVYKAEWANYPTITFRDAVSFMLNQDLNNGRVQVEILNDYLNTFYLDEYHARQETKYQMDDFYKGHMDTLVKSYIKDKKFNISLSFPLDKYDPEVRGFRLPKFTIKYSNNAFLTSRSSRKPDEGISDFFLRLDSSQFILPVSSENATQFLSRGTREVVVIFVYSLSKKNGRIGYADIHAGYLYTTTRSKSSEKPIAEILKVQTKNPKPTDIVFKGGYI